MSWRPATTLFLFCVPSSLQCWNRVPHVLRPPQKVRMIGTCWLLSCWIARVQNRECGWEKMNHCGVFSADWLVVFKGKCEIGAFWYGKLWNVWGLFQTECLDKYYFFGFKMCLNIQAENVQSTKFGRSKKNPVRSKLLQRKVDIFYRFD